MKQKSNEVNKVNKENKENGMQKWYQGANERPR
jgi:hypothetical protein